MGHYSMLRMWDNAVASHREYWRMLMSGQHSDPSFSDVKRIDFERAAKWIVATGLSGPDGVAMGGER